MDRADHSAPQDQRGLPRLRIELAAMAFPGGLSCAILDITLQGARVQFPSPPPSVSEWVILELDTGRAHQCEVAWRRGAELGVRFLSSCYVHGPVEPLFEEAETHWLKRQDRRTPVTTFHVAQVRRTWEVRMAAPTLAEPAVVAEFLHRWKAERYAREQVKQMRQRGLSAVMGAG